MVAAVVVEETRKQTRERSRISITRKYHVMPRQTPIATVASRHKTNFRVEHLLSSDKSMSLVRLTLFRGSAVARAQSHLATLRSALTRGNIHISGLRAGMSSNHGSAGARHLNRLANAKSPYLLQHAENPVCACDDDIQEERDSSRARRLIGTNGAPKHFRKRRKKTSPSSSQ